MKGHSIPLSSLITNLSVKLDSSLSLNAHMNSIRQTSFYHLMNISRPRPSLFKHNAEKLVHIFISSHLYGRRSTIKTIQRLQYVQNSAACVLTKTCKSRHITPVLHSLHWLPVTQRITYKLLLIVYKALHHSGPTFLQELLTSQSSPGTLRSGSSNHIAVPRTKLAGMGDHPFSSR